VTNPDSACGRGLKELRLTPVKVFALAHNLPFIQTCSLKDEGVIETLKALNPDLSVVVSYGMILPEAVLSIPKHFSINLHASLLPKYRGASPIQAVLEHGESISGVTIQYMAKELDKGDIIMQKEVQITPEDDYTTLSARLAGEGALLLMEAVRSIEEGSAKRIKQDDSAATFTKLIKKEDGRVSFISHTAAEITNKKRAYAVWPGVYTEYRNLPDGSALPDSAINVALMEIKQIEQYGPFQRAGVILEADKKGLIVQCREGCLSLLKLKPWGKKEMDYLGFINGYKPVEGRIF
jgi:methionyl-tRNA formyltransferase